MNRKFTTLLLALALMISASAAAGSAADELVIPLSELSGEPLFVDWTQDGTAMQLIALMDEDGLPRLAFNTCQSCLGSPYAWFEFLGDGTLQCQNCGLTFGLDAVGTELAAGCNPVTLSDFSIEGSRVIVDRETLSYAVPLFANWKRLE